MDNSDWLARRFEANRSHLRAVAYRMLGSASEADDAVQESWLRLSRTDASAIENLGGWLTTVVARVSLDMLRSRTSHREQSLESDSFATDPEGVDPEYEALLADSVGPALLIVLDTLNPAERLAFVLHDMFAVPFSQIADIVGRSPGATRQLASRARQRVQGATAEDTDRSRQREIVDAFLAASHGGDFEALLRLLDPDVVLRTDATSQAMGTPSHVDGALPVAELFAGRARAARPALINDVPGAVWAPGGKPLVAFTFTFTIAAGRITSIDVIADHDRVSALDVSIVDTKEN